MPGYMDASYYFTTSVQLARGEGFTEPFIWNYLADPQGIPHPSHSYWMPLATIVASIPLFIGPPGFRTAQAIFILLAAFIPVLTSLISFKISRSETTAKRAGVLALAPGFFLPYLVTTDNFVLFALAGSTALWLMAEAAGRGSARMWVITGLVVGLCNLARTDGLLFLVPAIFLLARSPRKIRHVLCLLMGYLVVITPWWVRNLSVSGSILGGAGTGMAFMMDYNELFRYPGDPLTISALRSAGFIEVIRIRLESAWSNLTSLIVVNGLIILTPFIILGVVEHKKQQLVQAAGVYLFILYGVMSFVFPLAGYRGGFFHSSAALMPIAWALAPVGFERMIHWGVRNRNWEYKRSAFMFGSVVTFLAFGLTGWNYYEKVLGSEAEFPIWEQSSALYQEAGQLIDQYGGADSVTAVKDPPSFHAASGIPAVVIPDGDVRILLEVVNRYSVKWVLIDIDHPVALDPLYNNPPLVDWLQLHSTLSDAAGNDVYLLLVSRNGSVE